MPDGLNTSSRSAIGRPLGVFRHRPFLIFWIGACISNTGNWTENAAQSWAVTSQTIGNPHQGLLVEILQFADFCPVLLLALLAGVISDRVNRKVWLITLQGLPTRTKTSSTPTCWHSLRPEVALQVPDVLPAPPRKVRG